MTTSDRPIRTDGSDRPASTSSADRAALELVHALALLGGTPEGHGLDLGEDGVGSVTTGAGLEIFNGVVSVGHDPDPREIERRAEAYAGTRLPWSIQLRTEQPPAEIRRIGERFGLSRLLHQPLMVADLGERFRNAPPLATGYVVDQVSGGESELYRRTLATAFGVPDDGVGSFADPDVLDDPAVRGYVGRRDGEVVAIGESTLRGGALGLFSIATLPEHRRLGYGRALTQRMLLDGAHAGATTSFLQASEMGRPLYESLGFRAVENWAYLV